MIIRVTIAEMFINCPRYIHRYKKIEESTFTPQQGKLASVPEWKKLKEVQDVLPERDKNK